MSLYLEKTLKELWISLLNVDRISGSSDFFLLGGHHRLVIKLLAAIKEKLDVNITVRDLVENSRFDRQLWLLGTYCFENELRKDLFYPPTIGQQSIWTINKLRAGQSIEHNIAYIFFMPVETKVDCLNKAISMLVEKHCVLRSRFSEENGVLIAKLAKSSDAKLRVFSSHEHVVEKKLREIASLPFDLEREPAIRFYLLPRFGKQLNGDAIFIVNHQIVHDGDSFATISKELIKYYSEPNLTKESLEESMPFVEWAKIQTQKSDSLVSQEYWQQKLSGFQPTKLELGKAWQPRKGSAGCSRKFLLEENLTKSLQSLASQCQTTLSVVLLAALYVLLERYCQQEDLSIGMIDSDRTDPRMLHSIGFFRNLLPIRIKLVSEKSLRELIVDHLKPAIWEAREHNQVQPRIMTTSGNAADLFNIVFAFSEASSSPGQIITNKTVQHDLTVNAFVDRSNLEIRFDYSSELYSNELMEDFARNYLEILGYIPRHQDDAMLSYDISFRKLVSSNSAWDGLDQYCDQTILNIFQQESFANSSRTIIEHDTNKISAELFWQTVKAKANHLQEIMNNNTEVRIGIPSQRSFETLSDMVAILFAGGAFVPYDPADPADRRDYILNDADVKFCIVNGEVCYRDSAITLPLRTQRKELSPQDFRVNSSRLAYIIYTSGSTGRPKGVRISHRALWHYAKWWDSLNIQKLDHRIDFSGSLTFDASITTTLIALAYKALIIICPEPVKKSPHAFVNYLIDNKIELCKTTPSYFKLLLKESLNLKLKIPQDMCWLLIGEEMNPQDCLMWLDNNPHHIFYNAYGPTEATVFCSAFRIDCHNINEFQKNIPIEKDSRAARFHIVDEKMRELPYGIKGELCIEGPILADSYQNRPQETNSSFLRRPDHSIWYRTGDQVMELCDATIIFLGRKDQQLKIRGVRVELEEIRQVICSLQDVADAIVLAKMNNDFPELVALVVPVEQGIDRTIFCDSVQQHLISKVSASMTPHHFIVLDKLPYNKASKVDMQALRSIVENHNIVRKKMLVTSPLELSLLQIWRSSLGPNKIGVDSNFFNVGGNSLLAMQVMDRINRHFNISLSPDLLFKKPSIRELGQAISDRYSSTSANHFHHAANSPALFMIHPATGIAHVYQILNGQIESVDFYGITSDHFGEKFYSSIEEMAHSYLKIIKKHRPKGPYFLGGYCTGGVVAFEMGRQLELTGESPAGLVLIDSYNLPILGSKEDREVYNKAQLNIMGIPEHSLMAQKMIDELDHNQLLVVNYQPKYYSGDCLFFYCQNIDPNDSNKQHLEELKSRLNGWDRILEPNKTKCIGLNTFHRSVFRDAQIVSSMALEINQFIRHTNSRNDKFDAVANILLI